MHQFQEAEFINNIYNIGCRWELEYVGCKLGCRCILWIAWEGNGAERKPGCRALVNDEQGPPESHAGCNGWVERRRHDVAWLREHTSVNMWSSRCQRCRWRLAWWMRRWVSQRETSVCGVPMVTGAHHGTDGAADGRSVIGNAAAP